MTLPPTQPHKFYNEDGLAVEHPGYTVRSCMSCKFLYPLGKDAQVESRDVCGRSGCRGITKAGG